jgi:hypothetical protein
MLKVKCPQCNKDFFWSDDMPTKGKCATQNCNWEYNIHAELKRNINQREAVKVDGKRLRCPFCNEEISSHLTICRHCGYIIWGSKVIKKTYFFIAVCLILIVLSIILKYLV